MGDTILVNRRSWNNDEIDDWDHSVFLESANELDQLAERLGVAKPSDFFDWADYQFNMSEEELPESWIAENQKWYSPTPAIASLKAILAQLQNDETKNDHGDLIEELQDCLEKLQLAERENDQFNFFISM